MYTEQSNQVALEKFKAMIKIINSKKAPGYDPITAQLLKDRSDYPFKSYKLR